MQTHWSRFGYTTSCGKHLNDSKHLTRTPSEVTCETCKRVHGIK